MRTQSMYPMLVAAAVGACADSKPVLAPVETNSEVVAEHGRAVERYVSIGTSISMGWASNGVYEATQRLSWPTMLAFAGSGGRSDFSVPLIESPGCTSPLVAPLGEFRRLSGETVAPSAVCANNAPGVTLPERNVGIAGAIAADALLKPAGAPNAAPWYQRVLAPGQTQVSATLSQQPTLVSVELGGNEVLNASSGLALDGVTMVPFANFVAPYTAILNALRSDGRKVLLIGMPSDLRRIPMMRRGDEIWADREAFADLNIRVEADCEANENWINVSLKTIGTAIAAASSPVPVSYSCADRPFTIDYVLTPADVEFVNKRMADMDAFIRNEAAVRGYAYASLGAIFDSPLGKGGKYSIVKQLTSHNPYGPLVSLDGVHPSPLGHALLALASAKGLNSRYGSVMARATNEASAIVMAPAAAEVIAPDALDRARAAAARLRGVKLPACPLPGVCGGERQ